MAGSYEHIQRATKPTDNTAESYGGLDTSLVENMGDAIEAMVHMWWMIQILAKAARTQGVTRGELIKQVSHEAAMIEVGRVPVPPDTDYGEEDDDDEFPSEMPGVVGFEPDQVPPRGEFDPPPTMPVDLVARVRAVFSKYFDGTGESDNFIRRLESEVLAAVDPYLPGDARHEKPPADNVVEFPTKDDLMEIDPATLAKLRFAHAKREPPAGPIPLPTDWTPTMYLRFVRREFREPAPTLAGLPKATIRFILQQGYVHADGNRIWVDVPSVEEGT